MNRTKSYSMVDGLKALHLLHWVIISLSILFTISGWWITKSQINEKTRNAFERESSRVVELIVERMGKYEDALWAGAAALNAKQQKMLYSEWKQFSQTLSIEEKYPGINGIGIIHYVSESELHSYLEEQRTERPEYKIHPPHNQKEFWPISYIEPVEKNLQAVGLDMAHEQNRFDASRRSRDTGNSIITAPITLVQDSEKTPGFLFFVPFYNSKDISSIEKRKEHFEGLVYAPFITKKLMDGTLDKSKRHVSIEIYDDSTRIFTEYNHANHEHDLASLYQEIIKVPMYGRTWDIHIKTNNTFKTIFDSSKPTVILIAGIIIDSLIIILFMVSARNSRQKQLALEETKKQLNEIEQLSASIIQNTVDGIITIDQKGSIQNYNPACEKIFGFKEYEVIDKNIKMLMPEPYHSQHDSYLNNYMTTGKKKIIGIGRDVEGKRKDGSCFPIELSISEIVVNKKKLFTGIIRDITERKLEEKMKNEFISTVNHEIRTPLTAIQASLGLMKSRLVKNLDQKSSRLIELAYDNCNRLTKLVNDILDIEKITAGKMEYNLEKVEMINFVQDIIERHQSYAEQYNVEFLFKSTLKKVYCNVDQQRFNQAFVNLLSNAAKFSNEGKRVNITVKKLDKNKVKFSVQDYGIGISDSFRDKVFDKFSQADGSNTRNKGGSGLGLSISLKIIEEMGGEITFESKEGVGTTFFIILKSI